MYEKDSYKDQIYKEDFAGVIGRSTGFSILQQALAFQVLVNVKVSMGIHPDGMGASIGWAGPASKEVPIQVSYAHESVQFRDENGLILIYVYVTGAGKARPLGQESSIRSKHLNPVVLPVGHYHPTVRVDPNTMGHVELSWSSFSRMAPGEQQVASGS